MPERDIESLDVMGWGLDAVRKFFCRHRRRRRRHPPTFVCLQYKSAITRYQEIGCISGGEKKALRERSHPAPYF